MKKKLASLGNRADQMGERISDTEDRNVEWFKWKRKNRELKKVIQKVSELIRKSNL